jgi:acetyl-CoA carboxylase carboxyl transferase alpha subunit/acetyl-CoA carboxylase carboxyl transferase beta subunit
MTISISDRATSEWVRCTGCRTLLYGKRLARNLYVCPDCGTPRRLTAWQRVEQLADAGTFEPFAVRARSTDPLGFTDTRPYEQRLSQARLETGLDEGVLSGVARIGDRPVVLSVMDFRFMGGSLGTAMGELLAQAADEALERRLPLLLVSASGGARMQEGCLSLMQMACTSQAIARLQEAGLLTISLISDPTYGGVAASFATNTDLILIESNARMGFAGPRVIKQTIGQDLPAGFQTADFLFQHGQVDMVVERRDLRRRLERLLAAGRRNAETPCHDGRSLARRSTATVIERDPDALAGRDPWEVVQLARNIERPTTLDYLARTFDSFIELHGDRVQGDCSAIVAGFAELGGQPLVVIGHQKGHSTRELVAHNFGMPRPQGYRKALRVMKLAARLGLPIVTLVDTPGAYPGVDAEESGQALAIAQNILEMSSLRTPIVSVVTGEGGSGGALALAVADTVLMLENTTYSVITPEGCSSILWNTAAQAAKAARALRIVAPDLLRFGIVDGVVLEPPGGAHSDIAGTAERLRGALLEALPPLRRTPTDELVEDRRNRFRRFGRMTATYDTESTAPGNGPEAAA